MNDNFIVLEYYISVTNVSEENNTSFFHNTTFDEDETLCDIASTIRYNSSLGIEIAVSEWEALITVLVLLTIILGTIFGNVLVIMGVFIHKPLRIVQNFFIVSLAVADIAVAVLVMPFNVAYSTFGKWLWGKHLCKMWLTCDILCCTSSILNLCAIALDRYGAITDPVNYANKRTMKRVILQIGGVWILSLVISSPPLLGWNDWPAEFTKETPCQLTSEQGYVIYSSLGSFFIPLVIMTMVYIKIYIAAKQRFRRRTLAARIYKRRPVINVEKLNQEDSNENKEYDNKEDSINDNDSDSGESINRFHKQSLIDMKKHFFVPLLLLHDPIRQKIEFDVNKMQSQASPGSRESCKKRIVNSIKRVSQKKKKQEKPLLASVNKEGDVVHQFIKEKQKISLSKERRAARTLGIIMGVFVICWLPFFLMYTMLPFCPSCCPSNKLINFITWLGYVNSTVNPIIYTIFNLDFRKAFKKMLGISDS